MGVYIKVYTPGVYVCMCVYLSVCNGVHMCVCIHSRIWTQRLCVVIYRYMYTHRVHVCVCVCFRVDTQSSHVGMYVFPCIRTGFIFVFM